MGDNLMEFLFLLIDNQEGDMLLSRLLEADELPTFTFVLARLACTLAYLHTCLHTPILAHLLAHLHTPTLTSHAFQGATI